MLFFYRHNLIQCELCGRCLKVIYLAVALVVHAVNLDNDTGAALPVASAASILYSEDFQGRLLNIDEQVILNAIDAHHQNSGSYTIVAEAAQFCVYSNNRTGGMHFSIEPRSFGTLTNKDSGAKQDDFGGDMLRFYNTSLKVGLPYFVIVEPNQAATSSDLLGNSGAFTVRGSQKPLGSVLPHLQAGIWGKIDHYDVTSNRSAESNFGGCPGDPIVMKLGVLNKDLISVPSGVYGTGFTVSVDVID